MSSKINLQTCEYARKSSIFQDNQLINRNKKDVFTRVMAEGYPVGWAVLSYNEE